MGLFRDSLDHGDTLQGWMRHQLSKLNGNLEPYQHGPCQCHRRHIPLAITFSDFVYCYRAINCVVPW